VKKPQLTERSVALDLDIDMQKYGNWRDFNKEFERRLNRKERDTNMHVKKQKGDDFKYPNTIWRQH